MLGQKVPVENTALGQADTHWRASVFGNEMMQPFVVAGRAMPLSRATLRSLQDLGYTVDLSQADAFSLPLPSLRQAQGPQMRLDGNTSGPIRVVDSSGRVVRIINP